MSSAARELLRGDDLPALPVATLKVREADPSPGRGPERDTLAALGEARVRRNEDAMLTALDGYLDRLLGVALARLQGPRARKNTRWWSDRVTSEEKAGGMGATPTYTARYEVKALDSEYVLPPKTVTEVAELVRPVGIAIVADSVADTARRLGRPNVGLAVFDQQAVDRAVDDAVRRMLAVADRHATEIRRAIMDADTTAKDLDEVLDRVREAHRRGGNWVRLAGRTLAISLGNDASLASARALGVTHVQWLSRRDERVRVTHRIADGQVRRVGDAFTVGRHTLRYPADPEGLPETWEEVANCVIGSTVVAADALEESFRSRYVGDIVTIRTASGRVLTGTPNHPVLTERGWVGLGQLHEGDHVIGARGGQQVPTGIDPDVEDPPVTAEQVHGALGVVVVSRRIGGASVDFHGDRPTGEVDVVGADRQLRLRGQTTFGEQLRESSFPGRDVRHATLTSQSERRAGLIAARDPANRIMGSLDQVGASDCVELGPAHPHRFAPTPRIDTGFDEVTSNAATADAEGRGERLLRLACEVAADQPIGIEHMEILAMTPGVGDVAQGFVGSDQPRSDGAPGYPELLSDACRALAGPVEADRVIEIFSSPFDGHVYTLQAGSGVYLTAGIISKNCRCSLLLRPPDQQVTEVVRTARRGTRTDTVRLVRAVDELAVASALGDEPRVVGAPPDAGLPDFVPAVPLTAPIAAYRLLDEPLAVSAGQWMTVGHGVAFGLAPPAVASALLLTVVVPAGFTAGVGGGALVLPTGTVLEIVSITSAGIVAQPVA